MGERALYLDGLTKRFGPVLAVDDVTVEVGIGEFLTLLGSSGSGKTTTLMMIAGFIVATEGRIFFGDRNVTYKPPHKRNVGVVFQNYALFPHMTVFENVAFPLAMRRLSKTETEERVAAALQLVQLGGFEGRYPRQLSGGQQQRVALARALVFQPPLLLMDEPLGALDRQLRQQMQLEIKHIQRALGITVVYVTHDQEEALVMSNRIAIMSRGRIIQVGTPSEVYQRPADRFVAQFVGESSVLEGRLVARDAQGLEVELASGQKVRAPDPGRGSPGATVTLAFRPERTRLLGPGADGAPGENVLAGTLEEITYAGEVVKFHVRVGDEGVVTVKELSRGGELPFTVGSSVGVAWAVADTCVL